MRRSLDTHATCSSGTIEITGSVIAPDASDVATVVMRCTAASGDVEERVLPPEESWVKLRGERTWGTDRLGTSRCSIWLELVEGETYLVESSRRKP